MKKFVLGLILIAFALGLLFAVLPAIADSPAITEFPICTNSAIQRLPDISGDIVVWDDNREGLNIYAYNLSSSTESLVSPNSTFQQFPSISGNMVVWHDYRNGNYGIYSYNLSSNTELPICSGPYPGAPAVSGEIVVWADDRNGETNWDVFAYNLSSSTEFPICTNLSHQGNPEISGDIIVWKDNRNGSNDIYGYNLSSSTEFVICNKSSAQDKPAISGDIVVWEDGRNGNLDIYGCDLSDLTEFLVCNAAGDQMYPAVSGDIVVWQDHRNGSNYDIYGYNLSTLLEFPICTNSAVQVSPDIWQNTVVWGDSRGNTSADIYGAILEWPTPTPSPTASPTASPTPSPSPTPSVSPTTSPTGSPSPSPTPTSTTEWWSIRYRTVGGQFVTIYSILCVGPLTVNSSDFPYTEMTINFSKGNAPGGYRDVVIEKDSFVSDTFNITLAAGSVPGTLSLSDDATGKLYVQGSTGDVDVFSNTTEAGTNFNFGDGTLDVAGSLLLDMPLEGDFDLAGQHKILSMDTYMTTNYSYNNAIRPGCNIDNSVADGYGIPFMQVAGPSPYVGTDGTIIGTLSLLDQRWIGFEWDFQFKLVMELEPVPNPGDVNNDGRINCLDITQCELCILYPGLYPKESYPGWDANEDNEGPNAGDILAVELRILGLWPP